MPNTIPCERHVGRWRLYYRATCQRSNSALAAKALPYVARRDRALDLGAGAMNDASFFLDSGFKEVTAVDACPDSVAYAEELSMKPDARGRFRFRNVMFSEFFGDPSLQETESHDLVHSNFALPYHGVAGFDRLMTAALELVRVGGVFSSVFFGEEDGWKHTKLDVPFFSKAQIEAFFEGFEMLDFKESKLDGHMLGSEENVEHGRCQEKFWHTFTVVARRASPVL